LQQSPAESLSTRSGYDLQLLVAGQSTGVRSLSLRRGEGQRGEELPVVLHSLPDANGAPALRMAFLKISAHEKSLATKTDRLRRSETVPVFQRRLEPLIDLGLRAFKARRRILLLGETGVGKTTLAMQMHHQSGAVGRPFVHINCSSISESLFEAEMFGYERGAFTGALASGKVGFIEAASGGTLFLDEIGDMPLSQQAKLLKFLEDGTIQPVGSPQPRSVDVYVVCATNRDLAREVAAGRFREDLYYRIAMIPLEVPPLRAYRTELPVVIDTMIGNLNLSRHQPLRLSVECREHMIAHDYPGNMRELIGVIARLDVVADDIAEAHHLPNGMTGGAQSANREDISLNSDQPLRVRVQAYERQLIEAAVSASKSKREAARSLGMDVASLIRKLARDKPS
jgi:transcriptional regulator with PAS, ATPase and Fis domain